MTARRKPNGQDLALLASRVRLRPVRRPNGRDLRRWQQAAGWLVASAVLVATAACRPGAGPRDAEDNDPNLRRGEMYRRDMRYADAERAFQKALQSRPDSAAAHWQLGILYFEELKDWPGALYHFDRYTRLRPKSRPDLVKQLTDACKQELAKQVPLGHISLQMQREITELIRTNTSLREEVHQLQGQVRSAQRSLPASPTLTLPSNPPPIVAPPPDTPAAPPARAVPPLGTRRTHTIRSGETMAAVARAHGLSLGSVVAANPGVDPRRLQPGQVIQLPNP